VHTIDEGIAILTGIKAGKKTGNKFEETSINYLVDKRLREFSALLKEDLTKDKGKPAKEKKDKKEKKGKK
jgi:uncharacterized protein YaiI (UPF0178 family)